MEDSIATFINHFKKQLDDIKKVESFLFRKILLATLMDPLARAAYGTEGTHRERITKLINNLSSWKDGDRVSLPQLILRLQENELEQSELYKQARSLHSTWQADKILRINGSPFCEDMRAYCTNEHVEKALKDSTYSELFYTYRNNLIHEFREPGYGIEMSEDGNSPYYHSMKDSPWQLIYPMGFFERLCASAIESLPNHFRSNEIVPHEQFDFGSLWRAR